MNYPVQPDIRLTTALLLALLIGATSAGGQDLDRIDHDRQFTAAGIQLGMNIDEVTEIYPGNHFKDVVANCSNRGPITVRSVLTSNTLRRNNDKGDLVIKFVPLHLGARLSHIFYDRPVSKEKFNMRRFVGDLTEKYGPYNQILYRRKMEPAGRIIGFEWRNTEGATLRVELRNDYRSDGSDTRLSVLARLGNSRLRSSKHKQSKPYDQTCAFRIGP